MKKILIIIFTLILVILDQAQSEEVFETTKQMLDRSDFIAIIRLEEFNPKQVTTKTGIHKGAGPDKGKVFPYEYEYQEWALKGTVVEAIYGYFPTNITFFASEPLSYNDGFHTYGLNSDCLYFVFLRETNHTMRLAQDSNQYIVPLADKYRVDWFKYHRNSNGIIMTSELVSTNMEISTFKKWIVETKN
jgi:hypothetical protein